MLRKFVSKAAVVGAFAGVALTAGGVVPAQAAVAAPASVQASYKLEGIYSPSECEWRKVLFGSAYCEWRVPMPFDKVGLYVWS
jgi:hypothetical protein